MFTQQPCNSSPVFCLIKQLQKLSTAKDVTDCGLTQIIDVYFTRHLHSKGLNLDGNLLKKKALVDFIFCLPVILEATMKMRHIRNSFVEAGKIDEETGTVPVLDKLLVGAGVGNPAQRILEWPKR